MHFSVHGLMCMFALLGVSKRNTPTCRVSSKADNQPISIPDLELEARIHT